MDGAPSKHQPFRRLDYESSSLLMRPSHPILESPYFQFKDFPTFLKSIGSEFSAADIDELRRLDALGLPPIISRMGLASLLGVNPGLIWSFCKRPFRYYRIFEIPKGKKFRTITAPRVVLKIVQKWLSIHIARKYIPPNHVFGFVSGRSHLDAAMIHCSARWIFGVDVKSFFQTTPQDSVKRVFEALGYSSVGAELLMQITCINGFLAQGSPISPVLSNFCMSKVDSSLSKIAADGNLRLTRYADDVVFSGVDEMPADLPAKVAEVFSASPWILEEEKTRILKAPARLKVHGLLVHGETIRLTKGYRNRLRAYSHLKVSNLLTFDASEIDGHLLYAKSVSMKSNKDHFGI